MMTTTIKKINQEKTHQKHASNVEAAAMKHSQEKKNAALSIYQRRGW
jgi:hypothetical protein